MKFGLNLLDTDPSRLIDLACEAEAAGWDGVFIADCIAIGTDKIPPMPFYDPWVALGALAIRTERIRLGTMIVAIARRRPWKLAREAGTVDRMSNGRFILGLGLGAAEDDGGFFKVGEAMSLKVRAERMDEGLAILDGLWTGREFSFCGKHYQVDRMTMLPPVVQKPRIPIWVVGVWPREPSLARTARWDGIIPQRYQGSPAGPAWEVDDIARIRDDQARRRNDGSPFDLVVGPPMGAGYKVAFSRINDYERAGATWWIEAAPEKKQLDHIRKGPPRP